jgi:hypothetical protein
MQENRNIWVRVSVTSHTRSQRSTAHNKVTNMHTKARYSITGPKLPQTSVVALVTLHAHLIGFLLLVAYLGSSSSA